MQLRPETLLHRVFRRARRLRPPREFRSVQEQLRGRDGIEIGGPSALFERWNLWPLYPVVRSLDNYNFATQTIWSEETQTPFRLQGFARPRPHGRELLGEASALTEVESSSYDFLLASHVLEHVANPLKALHTWRRVVRPGGTVVLVVPHRDGTFDHRRPITPLDHIVSDLSRDVTEHDETHLQEILDLHDLSRDPGAGTRERFVARAKRNIEFRSLHHHVFDTELVLRLVDKAGLGIVYLDVQSPYHICVGCSSPPETPLTPTGEVTARNSTYWSPLAPWRRRSVFPSDRRPGDSGLSPSQTIA